jgi:hypothetical protein
MSNLTNEEITDIWEAMPGQPGGWLKEFGYIQFARAIEKETASRCGTNGGITGLEGLTRYDIGSEYGQVAMEELPYGAYVKFADVERILAAPAAVEQPTGDLPPLPWGDDFEAWLEPRRQKDVAAAMHDYARAAIAAHLARQAQAEPVAWLKFWAAQFSMGEGNIGTDEGLEVCSEGEIGMDGRPAFPVYAAPAPPAGAQNAEAIRNQAYEIAARIASGYVGCEGIVKRIRALQTGSANTQEGSASAERSGDHE